jgi:hypothetical protein
MKRPFALLVFLSSTLLCTAPPLLALVNASQARIVRLSLVQGDVRFAQKFHRDSLNDSKTVWEVAPLNLPIRQGYALATDNNGRAEVEFENGAMAFLSANTLIEFYDLSLDDGAYITRLVLRQGSAIFYAHPANGDFFSVTGGDFSVVADGRTTFRLDNFDDGSTVNAEQGHVTVLRNKESKPLEKGESYSINVNEGGTPVIGRAGDSDDFDKWVSGRIESVETATDYSSQYANSSNYSSGFADLYTYGSWYNLVGYGYCWQPFGMGTGWSPFAYGGWYFDPLFGWTFIGSAPWGWLPYHYGGWVFNPVRGWVWVPSGLGPKGPVHYRPVTAVWVHSLSSTGLVPLHPIDTHGKPPLNLGQGVYAVHNNALERTITPSTGEKWAVLKQPPHEALTAAALALTTPPTRVSRTVLSGNSGSRPVTLSRDSSIVYAPGEHRFVNGNEPAKVTPEEVKTQTGTSTGTIQSTTTSSTSGSAHPPIVPRTSGAVVASRPSISPPRAPSSSSSHSLGSSHTSSSSSMGHSSGGGHH